MRPSISEYRPSPEEEQKIDAFITSKVINLAKRVHLDDASCESLKDPVSEYWRKLSSFEPKSIEGHRRKASLLGLAELPCLLLHFALRTLKMPLSLQELCKLAYPDASEVRSKVLSKFQSHVSSLESIIGRILPQDGDGEQRNVVTWTESYINRIDRPDRPDLLKEALELEKNIAKSDFHCLPQTMSLALIHLVAKTKPPILTVEVLSNKFKYESTTISKAIRNFEKIKTVSPSHSCSAYEEIEEGIKGALNRTPSLLNPYSDSLTSHSLHEFVSPKPSWQVSSRNASFFHLRTFHY